MPGNKRYYDSCIFYKTASHELCECCTKLILPGEDVVTLPSGEILHLSCFRLSKPLSTRFERFENALAIKSIRFLLLFKAMQIAKKQGKSFSLPFNRSFIESFTYEPSDRYVRFWFNLGDSTQFIQFYLPRRYAYVI